MCSQLVRPLTESDLTSLGSSHRLGGLLTAILKKQNGATFGAFVGVPYGTKIWDDKKLNVSAIGLDDFPAFAQLTCKEPIVGLVTRGVFEVYETVITPVTDSLSRKRASATNIRCRRKTTVVLESGELFGLFEAYAGWKGEWTIVGGVVSFLVCSPCGDNAKWRKAGRHLDVANLQMNNRSNCEFDSLIQDSDRQKWTADCVLFAPDLIQDERLRLEVENILQKAAIEQLYSVIEQNLYPGIKQNPTWGGSLEVPAPENIPLFMGYLDSVLNGRTPIFQVLDDQDEPVLPVGALLEELNAYGNACINDNCAWHILVPRKLMPGRKGVHPVNLVSRFPPNAGTELISLGKHTVAKKGKEFGRDMQLQESGENSYINYQGKARVRAYYTEGATVKGRNKVKGAHPITFLLDGKKPMCKKCNWHSHLRQVVIVEWVGSEDT